MFTITVLCWLSLATFPSVHANCWFAGKTRNTKDTCYGAVSPLSPGLERAANVPEGTPNCLGHRRSIEREDNRCSSPLLEKHSKKLTDIPASFYAMLNSRRENKENYCPGSKYNQVLVLLESRIENLLESFQKALYKQQNTNPTQRIYSPEEIKLFTDVHRPGLFSDSCK